MTTDHLCQGPDASQLIGFLCSLGLLETLTRSLPDCHVRLGFRWYQVGFRPVVVVEPDLVQEQLIQALQAAITERARSPELTALGDDLPCDPSQFEGLAQKIVGDGGESHLLSAFGVARAGAEKLEDTVFRTMNGAGHQHFLEFARRIAEQTTTDQLEHCLFEPWRYQDPGPSLRFDPADDRRYALRADNPSNASSSAPIRTVRAANALAFEGLALLPVLPTASGSWTTLARRDGRTLSVRWPLWEQPIDRDTASGVLAICESETIPGVLAWYEARRLTVGKFRAFSPARRVR